MAGTDGTTRKSDQILVRMTPELFASMQLALPFVQRRSMQDLVSSVLEGFVEALGQDDPGFALACTCLSESQARRSGSLLVGEYKERHPRGEDSDESVLPAGNVLRKLTGSSSGPSLSWPKTGVGWS